MKIGIFGGSFNPIHVGHISLARQLLKLAGLDEVWLMVSPQNPLKAQGSLLSDQLRFEMAQLALQGERGLVAKDYEFHLPKPSYTWNTLQHLKQDFPDDTFVLLIGGDNWAHFSKWYRAEEIVRDYPIVVYPRRGSETDGTALSGNVKIVDTELLDISSTMIREKVKKGECISTLVPACIEEMVCRYYASEQ